MNHDTWYFAFGSNMDPNEMEKWLKEFPLMIQLIPQAKRTRLKYYRFTFNKFSTKDYGTGKANIMKDNNKEVWGVLYILNQDALDKLKSKEKGYEIKDVIVSDDQDEKYDAVTFVAKDKVIQEGLKPTLEYIKKIIIGAKYHNLPSEYIAEIEELG